MPDAKPIPRRLWITILATVAVLATLAILASSALASGRENAYRWTEDWNDIDGAQAKIETENPNVGSGWVYHRVFVQNHIATGTYYAEMGWVKGTTEAPSAPKAYAAWRDVTGATGFAYEGTPSVGTSYNYKVFNTSGNSWAFYFDSLTSPVHNENLGWNSADTIAAGGETSDASISMGDVDYSYVTYHIIGYTDWTRATDTTIENTEKPEYEILGGRNSNNWRVKDK